MIRMDITGDIADMMASEITAGEKAVTKAVDDAGTELKTAWRGQITGAGLGQRLSRTIRSAHYPKGQPSLNAAALVWSKAPVIIGAHDTGPLIRSKEGFWLAIPTEAAGKSTRRGRITPVEWERRRGLRLRFIYRRRGPSLLVAEGRLNNRGVGVASRSKTGRGLTTVPIFLLVPQVKLRKRLDLDRDAKAAQARIPRAIVANWVESKVKTRAQTLPVRPQTRLRIAIYCITDWPCIDQYQRQSRFLRLYCRLGCFTILLFVWPFGPAVVLPETQQRLAHFKAGLG